MSGALPCGGIVLAGGASRRMGRPKEDLPLAGATLLDRAVRTLEAAGATPIACVFAAGARRAAPPPAEALEDRAPDRGPLEGIGVGLAALAGRVDAALVAAVDLPLLEAGWFDLLRGVLRQHDAALARAGGRLHPLAAVYRTRLAGIALALAEQGEGSPRALLARARVRLLEEAEVRAAGLDPDRLLLNANAPEDLERATRLLGRPPRGRRSGAP